MKNIKAKRVSTKFLCILLCAAIILSLGIFMGTKSTAHADEKGYTEFNTDITVQQAQFEGSTTTAPLAPGNWTGEYIGGSSGSGVVSGIIGLDDTYTKNYDSLKLDRYDEFKNKNDIPATPFGGTISNPSEGSYYPGTNKNVLMINNTQKTAYGYTSENINLDADSFYMFSVWVKTGIFGAQQGAAFTLTGLDKPVGLWNIDTAIKLPKQNGLPVLNSANNFGFEKQTIYIGTGSNSETVKIQLSVGDFADGDHHFRSQGYAFFDNVKATKMSATNYYSIISKETGKSNVCIFDNTNPKTPIITDQNGTDTDTGSFAGGITGWSKITDSDDGMVEDVLWGVYNSGTEFIEGLDGYGMTTDPYAPGGRFDPLSGFDIATGEYDVRNIVEKENNIMVLSSYAGNESYKAVAAGIKSDDILIEKESYYRLTAWYNSQEGGVGAVKISGQSTNYSAQYKLDSFVNGSLSSDSNTNRYGWQRTIFNIKGSAFEDKFINVELWLGSTEEKSSGIVMFDDITLTKLTYKEYSEDALAGTNISIDSGAASTTVANGEFLEMDFGDDDQISYPLAPTSWTYIDTATAGTKGHSNRLANTDSALKGVVPTDDDHYAANKENYLGIDNPRPYGSAYEYVNVLLLASPANTAFGYRSPDLSISGGSDYKITVNLATSLNGYGASLILKNNNSVVSNIEKIHTGGAFRDYSFYVSGAAGEANLTLEIWFGMTDTLANDTKLSRGHMFVNRVTMETMEVGDSGVTELSEMMRKYNSAPASSLDFAVYRLGAYDVNAYDRFSQDAVKPLYDMNLSGSVGTFNLAGAIVPGQIPANRNEINSYDDFYKAHIATENRFDNAIYLKNINSGYSKYASNNTLGLSADSFYKIDFSMMVALKTEGSSENAVGAGIWLADEGITDIRNTYKTPVLQTANGPKNEYEFQTFSFYFAVGSSDTMAAWHLTLGGDKFPNQEIAGEVFINYIVVTQIDESTFDTETQEILDEEEETGEKSKYVHIINNAGEDPETTDPETEDTETTPPTAGTTGEGCSATEWYLAPAILFAAAIFIAIFGVLFKKLAARHPRKKNRQKVVSYDRKETLSASDYDDGIVMSNQFADEDGAKANRRTPSRTTAALDSTYDIFDDEAPADTQKPAPRTAAVQPALPTTGDAPAAKNTDVVVKSEIFDNEFDD